MTYAIVKKSYRLFLFLIVMVVPLWYQLPYGLVVRIRGSHPRGPGSIPGVGTTIFYFHNSTVVNSLMLYSVRNSFFSNIILNIIGQSAIFE